MNVFNNYAKFYDTLYREKDYTGEVDYIERLFKKYAEKPPIQTILDLGCGSGGHAIPLVERGYQVTGVDRSAEMLSAAREKSKGDNPEFLQSDLTDIALGRKFDAVISMFAVLSYITENRDLLRAFQKIREHLRPGGLFFFDAWFGPAVLTDRASDRYKIIENSGERVIRFAHPQMDILSHTVIVNYKVMRLSGNQLIDEFDESHPMRFFFPLEVEHYLQTCGFELLSMHTFMNEECPLTENEWNMAVIARAIK